MSPQVLQKNWYGKRKEERKSERRREGRRRYPRALVGLFILFGGIRIEEERGARRNEEKRGGTRRESKLGMD
jgi:hypothetical protein